MTIRKLHFDSALLPSGWQNDVTIAVDDGGNISSVDSEIADAGAHHVAGAALPGVPNVHSHAHQRAMAGLAERAGPDRDSFWTWREVMYGFLARMTPDDLQAIAAQLYVEMLKSGFTSVGEFQYLHHGPGGTPYGETAEMSLRTLDAADHAGIGITSLPTLYAYGGFGGAEPNPRQERFLNGADRYLDIVSSLHKRSQGNPNHGLGISPHSLRAVTSELLGEVIAGLDALTENAPIHIHIAEQVREVEDCIEWCGKRPVDLLMETFDVGDRWCLIHATHMSDDETRAVAASGAVVGLCPATEANLGDGIFPAPLYLAAQGRIAIGSDSHISVSPVEELRLLEYGQRLITRERNVLAAGAHASTGRTLLNHVLSGGAQCLGRAIGALSVGNRADIVVLDTDAPALYGREGDALIDSWIFSGNQPCVSNVFVGGVQVVAGGRHIHEDDILADYRATIDRLSE